VTCVGDDDQIIFGWNGASGELVNNFKKIFPSGKIIKLE